MGLVMIVFGACLITYSSIGFVGAGGKEKESKNPLLGIVLTLCGCFFSSLLYATEEVFLRRVFTTGLVGVSNEGGWGLLCYAILLPIFNVVDDPFSDVQPKRKMEDSTAWFYQVSHSTGLICLHIGYVASCLMNNYSGMEVTNRVSAAARTTFDALRVIITWFISFIVGWEKWHNIATPIRFVGFVIVTIGVLVYNNVAKWLPFYKKENQEIYGYICIKQNRTYVNDREIESSEQEPLVDMEYVDSR